MAKKKRKPQSKAVAYQQPKNNQSSALYIVIIAAIVMVSIALLFYVSGNGAKQANSNEDLLKAISTYETQLKTNPNDSNLLVGLGNAYYDTSQWQKAVDSYEKALNIAPGDPNVLTDTGTAYWYMSPPKPDKAIEYYDKALKINAEFANAILNKGIVLRYGKKDAKKAIEQWEKYLKLSNVQETARVQKMIQEANEYLK